MKLAYRIAVADPAAAGIAAPVVFYQEGNFQAHQNHAIRAEQFAVPLSNPYQWDLEKYIG